MKKSFRNFLCLFTAVVMTVLCACGGDAAEDDPNLGVYKATKAELGGFEIDVSEMFGDGFTLELKQKGKGRVEMDGDGGNVKWTLDGDAFHAEGGGAEFDGTLSDGVLVIEDLQGSGVTLTLECDEIIAASRKNSEKKSKTKKSDKKTKSGSGKGKGKSKKDSSDKLNVKEQEPEQEPEPEPVTEKKEIPESLMKRYEGDWHGMIMFGPANGETFAERDGRKCDVIARICLDEEGNVINPFFAAAMKDDPDVANFRNVTAELDPDFDGMYISGNFLKGGSFDTVYVDVADGFMYFSMQVVADNGDSIDVVIGMKRPHEKWTDDDYPRYPNEGVEFYMGKSLEEILATFGNPPAGMPEQTHVTDWE